jgi:3-phosphoshikimate 1-carboxyvinyltransferase
MSDQNNSPTGELACPVAPGPLQHRLRLPGSKSLTNRELVLAALADHPSTLHSPLRARDTELMVNALRSLGATISESSLAGQFGPDLDVSPISRETVQSATEDDPITVDCGLAGTVMRFVPPVALTQSGPVRFVGDPQALARPMGPIIDALRQLGHEVDDDGRGTLPFTLTPRPWSTESTPVVRIDASGSSQFVSGLLLAAARFPAGLIVEHTGSTLPSLPHIEMTIDVLRQHGVEVIREGSARFSVAPGPIRAVDVAIEPDLSNALPFLAAAVVAGGEVTVEGWPESTTQVGKLSAKLLEAFGAETRLGPVGLTVRALGVQRGPLPAVSMDLREAGELAPTLVALSVFAHGRSEFSGIAHLRGHETNRLAALVANIRALGGMAEETDDGIIVTPAPLHGGVWKAWGDHRMATSGALIGLAVDGVVVDDIGQTAKTLPEFVQLWRAMLESAW